MDQLTKQEIAKILANLLNLRQFGPNWSIIGICGNLAGENTTITDSASIDKVYKLVNEIAKNFDWHSGSENYPIRKTGLRPSWDKDSPEGQQRWQLVDALIAYCEKELVS